MSLENDLTDIFGFSTKDESVMKLADSPLPQMTSPLTDSPSEQTLAYARASGTKPKHKSKPEKVYESDINETVDSYDPDQDSRFGR